MVASLLLLLGTMNSLPSTWSDGRVPEGDNAYTVARGEVRLALIGRSVLGLTDRLELSTDLLFPTPEIPFPNLHLKWRFFENELAALALDGGGGGGLVPFAGGGALPGPGFIVGVVGVGAALGSIQQVELHGTVRLAQRLSLSAAVGGYLAEGAVVGVALGAFFGGGGAGAVPVPLGVFAFELGPTVSLEGTLTFNAHNALIAQVRGIGFVRPLLGNADTQALAMPWVGYLHRWDVFTLTLGLYNFVDMPNFKIWKESHWPCSPFVNLAWTFGGGDAAKGSKPEPLPVPALPTVNPLPDQQLPPPA